jgi:hypothetical protein
MLKRCGKFGCDNGIIWMMSEFPIPCEECKKLNEKKEKEDARKE